MSWKEGLEINTYLRAYTQSASRRMLRGLEGWGEGSFHFVLILHISKCVKLKIFLLFKNVWGSWRDGSFAVFAEDGFSSKYSRAGTELSITPVPGGLTSSDLCRS